MNGKAVALMAVGAIVLYSGTKGKNLSDSARHALMGESPTNAATANPITGMTYTSVSGGGGVGMLTGPNSAIAERAKQDIGHAYLFGGYYTNPGGWDCSSACNWWLSRFGITLPGGIKNYQGNWHGPTVATYQLAPWPSVPRNQVAAGDIVLLGTHHMGIAVSNSEYISAENPSLGTRIDAIPAGANFKRIPGGTATVGGGKKK